MRPERLSPSLASRSGPNRMSVQSSNEDPMASLPQDVRAQLRETYLDEAGPLIDDLESALLSLEHSPDNMAIIAEAFRAAHTIKGSAAAVGLQAIAGFTHEVENILDAVRGHRCKLESRGLSALLGSVDVLRLCLAAARTGAPPPDMARNLAELARTFEVAGGSEPDSGADRASTDNAVATESLLADSVIGYLADLPASVRRRVQEDLLTGSAAYCVRFELQEDAFRSGLDPMVLLGALGDEATLYAPDPLFDRLPLLEEMDPETCYLGFRILAVTTASEADLRAIFEFCGDDATVEIVRVEIAHLRASMPPQTSLASAPASRKLGEILVDDGVATIEDVERALVMQKAPAEQTVVSSDDGRTIRIKQTRIDGLIKLVGKLVMARNEMLHLEHFVEAEFADPRLTRRLSETTMSVNKTVGQLQTDVLSLRVVPVNSLFQRLPRVVRDVAVREGKQIDLKFSGESTELDKAVADALFDPLVHLVRNSVDHGIEEPKVRLAAGKSEAGHLDIDARREGNDVIVEVRDDGAGINRDRVVAAAVEKGLIDAKRAVGLTDDEAIELLFLSGLSTAREVTDISGRGVGLDAVRSRLSQIGGSVQASSVPGKGSTMRMQLPLTLSLFGALVVFRALIVRVGKSVFALPLDAVQATVAIDPTSCHSIQGRPITTIQDHLCGLISLASVLALAKAGGSPSEPAGDWQVVVLSVEKHWVGLIVDSLDRPQEIMVKPVDHYLSADGMIVGASVLGDGRVALVLEPAAVGVAALAFSQQPREAGSIMAGVAQ